MYNANVFVFTVWKIDVILKWFGQDYSLYLHTSPQTSQMVNILKYLAVRLCGSQQKTSGTSALQRDIRTVINSPVSIIYSSERQKGGRKKSEGGREKEIALQSLSNKWDHYVSKKKII